MSFRIFGHTVTLTSPRCALRSRSIRVRDCPMPPPIDSGIRSSKNGAVVGQLQEVSLLAEFQLLLQGFLGDADAHGAQFVAALGDGVPHQDVAVQPVRGLSGFLAGVGDPVVVVGGAHLVRIAVLQWPADADNEDGRIFLQDLPSRAACAAGRDRCRGSLRRAGRSAPRADWGNAGPSAWGNISRANCSAPTITFQILLTTAFRK